MGKQKQRVERAPACTLVAAVFFQPALLGPPRKTVREPVREGDTLREGGPVAAE